MMLRTSYFLIRWWRLSTYWIGFV